MYRFKTFRPEDWFWITNEKEIRELAACVEKAIHIVLGTWDRWSPSSVWPIVVSGGCHERDTGYETFSGGEYPWREGRPGLERRESTGEEGAGKMKKGMASVAC